MNLFLRYKSLLLAFSLVITFADFVASASDGEENDSSNLSIGPELEKELRLTKAEKHALDKLKLVLPKEPTMPYLDMELLQIRWLRAHSLDVEATVRELRKLIQHRRSVKVANFWKQDWSDVFEHHPFDMSSFDKEGRPVVTHGAGELDFRKIILEGKRERIYKYILNIQYEILDHVMEHNKKHRNITQFVMLVNMDGVNRIQHACALCLPLYLNILQQNERVLPGFSKEVIFINSPSVYGAFLELLRPALSVHTSRVLRIFGTNKNQWKPYLDSKIDPKQLSWEFGGTKELHRDN